jgi:proprotein convertase subtilisin/kexin type 5
MTVYGKAEVSSVSYYYLAYNKAALNVDYLSEATLGRGNLGCYYPDNDCGNSGATSTTTFRTAATSVLDYNVNMFYMGIDSMIIKYDGSTNFKGEFNIIGMTQNSDSTIKVDFAFTGNTVSSGPAFSVGYSYFTFQTFYCSGPVDLYFVYQSNRCNSSCAISQYYLGRICQPCDATCYQCTGAPNTCGGCYNSQNRILVGTDCRCDTAAGFYDDGTSNVCPRCHYSCLTCDMVTPANRYFNVNTCPCLTGFYDANSQVCMPCHYSCQTATCNGGSSTSCASCNTAKNRAALHSSFVCPCAPGYYDIGVETCTLCHYSCLTCSGTNTNCLTCDATKFRSYSSGSKTCPCNTRYYDALVPLCAACDSTCWTCSGALAINCLSCDPAAQRTKVGNSCPCAVYYYDLNRVCTACFYTCLTCVNSTSIGCSTCNSTAKRVYNATSGECYCSAGYVDTGSQICPACYTGCLTCSGTANTCVTCHNNPGRYLAGASCLCQSNYVDFLSNGVCTLCHYSCLTCTSGTALGCSTCPTGRIQSGSSCVCPAGKYDDGVNVVCQTC